MADVSRAYRWIRNEYKYIIYADTSKRLSHFDTPKCIIYYVWGESAVARDIFAR